MQLIDIKCEHGATLKDLRYFVDKCKDLHEDTPVVMNIKKDNKSTNIFQIQGDEDSVVFYNW